MIFRPQLSASSLLLALTAVLCLSACDSCGDEAPDTPPSKADQGLVEFDAGVPDGGEERVELKPDMLEPVFSAVGTSGTIPKYIDIQLAHPVITDASRAANPATLVSIDPPMAGKLRWRTNSTLRFEPATAFASNTQYKVAVQSLESLDGTLTPDQPWTFEFTTPAFAFLRLTGGFAIPTTGGEVTMLFSAEPNVERLADLATWTLNGKPLKGVTYTRKQLSPHMVVAEFLTKSTSNENKLEVQIGSGLATAAGDSTAKEGQSTIEIQAGPKVELYNAHRKEGADGFYVSLVCKDEAAPGGTRYYWDRAERNDYRISQRCLPTEKALKTIQFSPKVKNLRVASGRGGFNILGDFKRRTYSMTIQAGMTTIDGGLLREQFVKEITIPARSPKLDFVNQGRYVPKSNWSKLGIRHLNTPEVEVEVKHVPERNLVFWLTQGNERLTSRTSMVVARETIDLKGKSDTLSTSAIDLANIIGKPESGLYEIAIKSGGTRDSVRLLMTDMNLIVKRGATKPNKKWPDEMFAWVIDMNSIEPTTDVDISLVRPNGEAIATCKTDRMGGCRLQIPTDTLDETAPFALIARKGDEFTYLKYDDLKVDPGDSETHGTPYLSSNAYRATAYSDRGVYRPGETAHFVGIIRNRLHQAPTAKVPVEIEIRDARSRVLRKFVERTNAAGMVAFDQKFEDFAATGAYNVQFRIAKKRLEIYRFNVEEFVPERMEVNAKTKSKDISASKAANVDIDAKYLFGGSAEGSAVELTCRVEAARFKTKKAADYRFGKATSSGKAMDLGVAKGELGPDGKLALECPTLDSGATYDQPGKLIATVAVFEAGSGRSTVSEATSRLHPEPYYIGLKTGTTKAVSGKAFDVSGVVVDWKGEPYKGLKKVDVEFIRLDREYYWYYDNDDGEDAWGQNIRPVVELRRTVKVGADGRFKLTATPGANSNAFVVRVSAGKAVTDLKLRGAYRYYYWDRNESRDMTPRPTRPTVALVEGPEEIEVNKPSTFKVQVPFKGRILMTTETHKVITHEWHSVEAGEFEWRFTLGKFTPNVYVSALLVKDPHLESKEAFMPDRAFGVTSARVKPTDQLHTIKIAAPDTVEPNSKLDISVDVGPSDETTFVTVAAVDEGILSLTKFKTPKPSKKLFRKRALAVDTFETIGWALKFNAGGPSSRTGGGDGEDYDDEEGGPSRAMPIKPVALWSGVVKVGKDGKAKVSFDIPRYRGALRIMAVASSKTRTGSADTRVIVRDPLVLQTTLPRFLSAGDQIEVPVFVTNMTGQDGVISVNLTSTSSIPALSQSSFNDDAPMVVFTGPSTKTIELAKDKSGTVVFALKAIRQAGVANFKVEAKLGSVVSYDEGIVPFRPSGPRERIVKRVELAPGKTSLTSQLEGWVPTSERSTVWVTNNPYGQSFDHLKYLIRYPYGCIEQTTSSTRPLLFVGQFIELIDPESVAKAGKISDMVNHGIKRVLSMQTHEGGFAYWPGGTSSHAWGTAYATHMLLDARDQGFDVPEAQLNRALDWLEQTAENLSNGNGRGYYRWAEPYTHYVLAKSGRGKKARIQQLVVGLKTPLAAQDSENAYMLWAALYLAGDRRYEKQLRAPDVAALNDTRNSRYSFYSDRRRRGFMLSIFHDLFGADKDGEALAILVGQSIANKPSYYYTTQELTWGITGLGKWVGGAAKSFSPAKLYTNGKSRKPTTSAKKSSDRTWSLYRASEYESLEVEVEKAEGKVYALISSEGVRTKPNTRYGGDGFRITRAFYNASGDEIEPDEHALGDLIYTVITIKNTSKATRYNLAMVDRFAAAFEVENPRLGRGTLPSWVDEGALWSPEHMNIRDDRMEVFGSLSKDQEVKFVYAVRAVSAGKFLAPGPSIEGMYDPEVWGRALPVRVDVSGPWADFLN